MARKYRRNVALALILGCLWHPAVWAQQTEAGDTGGTSAIAGKVQAPNGKAIGGARVLVYHLSTEKLYTSALTTAGGDYRIENLPYGYFDIAVETPDGSLYVGNQVVNVPPSGKISAVITATPYSALPASETPPRRFPGSDKEASGLAQLKEKPRGRDFWRSPKGVAILAGLGGVALLALASSAGGGEEPASSF